MATLDDRITETVSAMEQKDLKVTGAIMKTMTKRMSPSVSDNGPTFSNGWLEATQLRTEITLTRRHGEAASVKECAAQAGRELMRLLTNG